MPPDKNSLSWEEGVVLQQMLVIRFNGFL